MKNTKLIKEITIFFVWLLLYQKYFSILHTVILQFWGKYNMCIHCEPECKVHKILSYYTAVYCRNRGPPRRHSHMSFIDISLFR